MYYLHLNMFVTFINRQWMPKDWSILLPVEASNLKKEVLKISNFYKKNNKKKLNFIFPENNESK